MVQKMSGIAVGVGLLVLSLVTCQASECKPRTKMDKPCYKVKTREECLTSKDSRGGKYGGQDCVWCLHQCPDGNFCEPKNFLTGKNKIDRIDFESCLQNTAGKADIKSEYGEINCQMRE